MLPADVHRIPLSTPFQIGDVNAWLLRGEPLTLVDAGPLMDENEARMEAGLAAAGVRVEDLELIVLTHQHDDHAGAAAELRRRSGAAVAGTAALASYLADTEASMDADDGYSVALMRRHGVTERTVATLAGISRAYRQYIEDVVVDRIVAAGDELEAGGRRWQVRERPGHSPTDTVLASAPGGDGSPASCWRATTCSSASRRTRSRTSRSAPPTPSALAAAEDRPRTLMTYLASLQATADDDRGELILPGHGEPFTGAAALVEKRAEGSERRAEKILAALDHPRTAADVGRDLWRHVPVTHAYLVLSEVLGHLDLLEDRGAVAPAERDGVVVYARTG